MSGRVWLFFFIIIWLVVFVTYVIVSFLINKAKVLEATREAASNIDNAKTEVQIKKIKEKEKKKIQKIKNDI